VCHSSPSLLLVTGCMNQTLHLHQELHAKGQAFWHLLWQLHVSIKVVHDLSHGRPRIRNWMVSRSQNRGKHVCLGWCRRMTDTVAWVDSRTQETHRRCGINPGSGQAGPYVQQLTILVLKSTQNLGLQQSAEEEVC
jgi:hypothetical protein